MTRPVAPESVWERIVAQRSPEGHVVVADDDLIVRAVSPSVFERTGWRPEDTIGASVIELIDPVDRRQAEVAPHFDA